MSVAPVVLTVAGSDSGGGAGIQADLKTFNLLDVFGTTAITCVTAQNPKGVRGVAAIDPVMVVSQIDAVCDAFDVGAVKTGMLYSASIVRAVAVALRKRNVKNLVVDPVLIATSGDELAVDDALEAMSEELLPMAKLATPNVHEAGVLLGRRVLSVRDMEYASREIAERFDISCVVTGGDLDATAEVTNLLYHNGEVMTVTCRRVMDVDTHGTGCTFSAAAAAFLSLGADIPVAVEKACSYVSAKLSAYQCK